MSLSAHRLWAGVALLVTAAVLRLTLGGDGLLVALVVAGALCLLVSFGEGKRA